MLSRRSGNCLFVTIFICNIGNKCRLVNTLPREDFEVPSVLKLKDRMSFSRPVKSYSVFKLLRMFLALTRTDPHSRQLKEFKMRKLKFL